MSDLTDFVERGEVTRGIGTALLRDAGRMFRWWHRVRDGTLGRRDFQRRMRPVERSIRDMLWYGTRSADAKTRGTCRDILNRELALFTFVREEGVDPTNNAAERALRHAVIGRKACFGTWSPDGSAFVSRILTVVTTLRQQGATRSTTFPTPVSPPCTTGPGLLAATRAMSRSVC